MVNAVAMEKISVEGLEVIEQDGNKYVILEKKCVNFIDGYYIALVWFNDKEFVTYGYIPKRKSFFWGHYYKDLETAKKDYAKRY